MRDWMAMRAPLVFTSMPIEGIAMNTSSILPSLEMVKSQAKSLKRSLSADGHIVSHSQSLELIAQQLGFKDWNVLSAAIRQSPGSNKAPELSLGLGDRVTGTYLGQAFAADVIGLRVLDGGKKQRVTLHLDQPVDVVKFDSFSAFRQRINANIGLDGKTSEKTSDGRPQLELTL